MDNCKELLAGGKCLVAYSFALQLIIKFPESVLNGNADFHQNFAFFHNAWFLRFLLKIKRAAQKQKPLKFVPISEVF